MTFSLPQAKQDQLILDHRHLVPKIASKYTRWKGLEFEELVSEGTLGLVVAARTWEGRSSFLTYAFLKIRGHILDLIKKHREFVPHSGDETELHLLLHEWGGVAVVEGWDTLPTTPEAIAASFEVIRQSVNKGALAILSRRDQRMVKWHLIKEPRMKLAQVAREERMSYRKAMVIMRNAVRRLRAHVKFHPHLANDRFQIANSIERGELHAFLSPPVNNPTPIETGDTDELRQSTPRKTDRGVPSTAGAGGCDGARGVEASLLGQRRGPRVGRV